MNVYKPTLWQDDVYDEANKELIQEGTPMSRTQFNNMETGILASDVMTAVLLREVMNQGRSLADLEGEIREIDLTNSLDFPFNNSARTIALVHERDTLKYRVFVEVVSASGFVENVEVYDKALNGFKLRYTGSAKNVRLRYYVQGGML